MLGSNSHISDYSISFGQVFDRTFSKYLAKILGLLTYHSNWSHRVRECNQIPKSQKFTCKIASRTSHFISRMHIISIFYYCNKTWRKMNIKRKAPKNPKFRLEKAKMYFTTSCWSFQQVSINFISEGKKTHFLIFFYLNQGNTKENTGNYSVPIKNL